MVTHWSFTFHFRPLKRKRKKSITLQYLSVAFILMVTHWGFVDSLKTFVRNFSALLKLRLDFDHQLMLKSEYSILLKNIPNIPRHHDKGICVATSKGKVLNHSALGNHSGQTPWSLTFVQRNEPCRVKILLIGLNLNDHIIRENFPYCLNIYYYGQLATTSRLKC